MAAGSASTPDAAAPDWQVSHSENAGKATVVANFTDDPDDSGALHILVRGRTHEAFAKKLAELLQAHSISSHQV